MAFRKLLVAEAKVKVGRPGAALAQAEDRLLSPSAAADENKGCQAWGTWKRNKKNVRDRERREKEKKKKVWGWE